MAVKTIYKLNNLDFSPGIRAEYINENFDLVKRWCESERLRTGGWGLVEGFDLDCDLNKLKLIISDGVIINENGEEIRVEKNSFDVEMPKGIATKEQDLVVGKNSRIILKSFPYSDYYNKAINYNPPASSEINLDEIKIECRELGITQVPLSDIVQIYENIIILTDKYKDKKVNVSYYYAEDKMDSIFIKKDGSEYKYVKGTMSSSPSQYEIEDYLNNGYYFIGSVYWHVGLEVDVDIITIDRSYRPVYVDEDNVLYLNGKKYNGDNSIVFIEPKQPKENDLWYNVDKDVLYISRKDKNGLLKWRVVNDLSRLTIDYGVFSENEMPEDMQTFYFDDKMPQCRFEPGKNQLRIIIDQTVIMQDQYEELVENDDEDNFVRGFGFKLSSPLDYPSTVEVYVSHSVRVDEDEDIFQRISTFIDTACYDINEDTESCVISTNKDYEIGFNQLEVWLNGIKLEENKHFVELTNEEAIASLEDSGTYSKKFKILISTKNGDYVSYKITKNVRTYDNFRHIIDSLVNEIHESLNRVNEATELLNTVAVNSDKIVSSFEKRMDDMSAEIEEISGDYIKKSEGASLEDLQDEVVDKLIKRTVYNIYTLQDNSGVVDINNLKQSDFMSVYWINENQRLILIRDEDYLVETTENGISIMLSPYWSIEGSKIYVEAISIGK